MMTTTTTLPGGASARQRRLSRFCGWAAVGLAILGLAQFLAEILTRRWTWSSQMAAEAAWLGSAAVLALGWWWLRSDRPVRLPLEAAEGILVVGSSTFLGAHGALEPDPNHLILVVLPSVGCLVVARALFVGGGLTGTALLSVAALAPIVVAYAGMLSHMPTMSAASLATHTVRATLAMALVIAMAVFGSVVSGRLSRERHKNKLLGQYRLGEPVGRGGMGVVHRAHHVLMSRPVAIKLLPKERHDAECVRRFEREVELTSRLNHPNTVAIYDYGATPDGWPYYVMEFIDGWNLDELVEEVGPLPPDRAIGILAQVCSSLAEAHELGMIHRDIKPSNIIVARRGGEPDFVKVLDFGLAYALTPAGSKEGSMRDAQTIKGTPAYMAPEAVIGNEGVGPYTDLYSVGAVAYFLLTGTAVFRSPSVIEAFADQIHTPPESPSERLGRPLPPTLERVVLRCLQKSAANRPASARALRAELRACRTGEGWSEQDAEQWWKEHPPPASSPSAGVSTSTVTVAIDSRRQRWNRHG